MAVKLALDKITFDLGIGTAIVRAEDSEGWPAVRLLITRRFVEDTWRMAYCHAGVRRRIAERATELTALADQACDAGKAYCLLDDLSQTRWTNVPVLTDWTNLPVLS
jgi:hypothetical protein